MTQRPHPDLTREAVEQTADAIAEDNPEIRRAQVEQIVAETAAALRMDIGEDED